MLMGTPKIKSIISLFAVIIWIIIIFLLSSQPAENSNSLSKGIVKTIVRTVEQVIPGLDINTKNLNIIARKSAHFLAYFVLGILMIITVRRMGITGFKAIVISFFICIVFAITDEIHQLFVPGRGGQLTDVIIDSVGIIFGFVIYNIIGR